MDPVGPVTSVAFLFWLEPEGKTLRVSQSSQEKWETGKITKTQNIIIN